MVYYSLDKLFKKYNVLKINDLYFLLLLFLSNHALLCYHFIKKGIYVIVNAFRNS